MADLYSIFIAVENLEKAYIRDTVSHDEYTFHTSNQLCRYTSTCGRLIAQYKTSVNALGSNFNSKDFTRQYDVNTMWRFLEIVDSLPCCDPSFN